MAVLGGAALLGSTFLATPVTAQTVDELKSQIQALSQRVEELETQNVATPVIAPAQAVVAGDFPGSIKVPGTNTSLNVSGYVKVDVNFTDPTPVLPQSSLFGGAAIPVDGSVAEGFGWDSRITAYQTRFRIQTRTPSDLGEVRTYIETDFRGHSSSFSPEPTNVHTLRLRHAYGTLGNLLAGQTWGTESALFASADTIDFAGPRGVPYVGSARIPQVRYTIPFSGGNFQIAAQDNAGVTVANGAAVNATGAGLAGAIDTFPDGAAKVTFSGSWGTAAVSGVLHDIDTDCGNVAAGTCVDDGALGWLVTAGARIPTWGKDSFAAWIGYGEGTGVAFGAGGGGSADVIWNPFADGGTGDLDTVETLQFNTSYEHWWQDNLRSTVAYGVTSNDNDCEPYVGIGVACTLANGAAGFFGLTELAQSVHVNLIWTAVSHVEFGIEWAYFWTDFEGDTDGPAGPLGDDGDMHRVQLMAKFSF